MYEHIVFAPYEHVRMASLPGMYQRTITCNSLSKTYSITGWRLGWLIGPAEVVENAKKVHDFLTVGAPAPLQEAACVGVRFPESYYQELNAMYNRKRDFFCDGLERLGLKHNRPQGTYFVLLDISDFLALDQFKGWSDMEFGVLRVDDSGDRGGGGARLQLLPGAGEPPDPPAFRPQ